MKLIIFLCLSSLVFTQTVLNKNACNACTQFQSQGDCTSGKLVAGCEWIASTDKTATTAGKCQNKVTATYLEYCATLTTGCANQTGCAYVDSKCTHFTGCSAYTKTTTAECQAISYECVSDGTACIVASLCTDYKTQTICETTPSISGILKCKWDTTTGACRDYVCAEADSTLTTNITCSAWLSGCITRGKGCWTSPLPACASYTGDATSCATYIGSDGNCELAAGATNCQAKVCANAQNTTNTDADCIVYQKGCITTGKGCIQATVLPQCSTYQGDNSTCVGYMGSDGVCEGDAGGSQCRARKCENAANTYSTDADCGKYKTGCKTTGKGCIATLGLCSSYQGNATTCVGFVGTDGYCKGTSTTTSGNCAPKVCEEAPTTNTTEDACNKYQIGCKSTGAGCVKNVASCSTYTGDTSSCASRIGSEGNCTWNSGTNCTARTCSGAASTVNTNPNCSKWLTGCVTNGAGCVSTTTCDSSIKDLSCQGTTGCSWQPICTSNEGCSAFKSVSICAANKGRVFDYNKYTYKADGTTIETTTPLYKFVSCAWRSGSCYQMECSDLTGSYYATDANCAAALTGCISNKKDTCITAYDCSKLTGTMETCKGYAAYCTNVTDAVATSACISRKCSDNTDAADTPSCNSWLPGCITNGKGCVDYNTTCTSLSGTQATCNGLYGYKSGTITSFKTYQCYNTDSATATTACVQKICSQATGKTSDSDCSSFLTDCVYNGKDSCVDSTTATCTDFYNGSDSSYCEKVAIKSQSAKYCFGIGVNGNCKIRVCLDNSIAEDQATCDSFKSGCIVKSSKGCDDYTNVACTSQQGTITTCPNFFGNVSSVKVRCTKLDSCQDRVCGDIKTPTQASDCTTYKSTCRFVKSGSPCINENVCASYTVPDTANTDQLKFNYCTDIRDSSGKFCGFVKGAGTCSDRTCDQFLSTYTTNLTCITYYTKDVTTGSVVCKLASPTCYTPKVDCTYAIDATTYSDDTKKTTYCQLFTNDKDLQCTFKTGDGTCSLQNSCEKVITVTSAQVCNDFLGSGICQKGTNGTGCTTTVKIACNTYKTPSGSPADALKKTFCQSLKVIDDDTKFALGTGKYTSCIWKTGTTCDAIAACEDVPSAVSQADCDAQFASCYYYDRKCYASVATCPTSIPSGVTNTNIALYCMGNFQNGKGFCQAKNDQTGCETNDNTDCTYTFPTTGNWNSVAVTAESYCREHSDQTKKFHCIHDTTAGATKCKKGTCEDVPSPSGQGDCDKYLLGCTYINTKCQTIVKPGAASDCENTTKIPFGSNVTGAQASEKLAYCQSISATATTLYCTHDGSSAKCSDAAATCAGYTATVGSELSYCQSKVAVNGKKCSWTTPDTKCRVWDCNDISLPQSQVDCDLSSRGLTCMYYKGSCYNTAAGCTKVPANGATATEKQSYCEALTSNGKFCTYIAGANCADFDGSCATYDVAGITSGVADQLTACNRLKGSTDGKCTFAYQTGVTYCAKLDACTTYTVTIASEDALCKSLKSLTDSYPCKKDPSNAGKCVATTCEDITTGQTDCTKNASGCLYYQSICITKKVCGSYTFSGSPTDDFKKSWCLGVTDTSLSLNLCGFDSSTKLCVPRQCSDVKYLTDFDCSTYLKGCKTDGTKCVAYTAECNSLTGDEKFCNGLTDKTGKEKCAPATTASTSSGSCAARTCYDNVFAQSDGDCNTFMSGCVTRGTGCIPNTATCDQYRGTKTSCEAFKQYISTDVNGVIKYIYCSGDTANTITGVCKNRVCADNTTATDDTTCVAYLIGCVSNGAGCIDLTAGCSSYKGTNIQCAKFMGSSGTEYCQGTASDAITVAACRKRLCTDISATSDKDCYNGMKPLKDATGTLGKTFCVYDGSGCSDNNKTCSQFKGDVDSCALYTAFVDGPCKATTIGSIKGSCAKRVCIEAPNTLTTDADCKTYHPTCYTTGYGCTTNNSCSSLSNQASCQSRVTCTWSNQCKSAVTTCSSFSNTSQSQCVNTKVNGYYCAWSETGSLCKNQTCADQPGTIKDHTTCQAFSELCTTSGAGCISMQACSYYTVQSVCLAASTTKDGVSRCGWENNACRPRACGDKSLTTTAECDTFLSGCQTNGTTCVAAKTCTDFNGNQQYCQKSKTGPCLFVQGICYDYTQCEDVQGKSHAACQVFSPLCTSNGTNCVPITNCAATNLKVSCVVGTDGACGWLPAGGTNAIEKCQKFGACTDATAATNDVCYAYGPKCISDGTACVETSTCSNYKTATSCSNMGTDGLCFWNTITNACKLKDCGDSTANNTTNDGCASFTVASGSCTTDGTKCIPLSTCSSYVEAGCFSGTDGVCTFAYPIGTTTGTKSCRLKACEDIKDGTSNGVCTGISTKKCVSNGTACISKAACTSYTTKTACNGGGVDSAGNNVICAFTVTDATKPNIGTCKQFSQCSDANNDSSACQTKTGICLWKASGTATSCIAYACDTITSGTSCQPVPNFDGLSQTVCNLVNGKCTASDPGTIADTNCYTKSAFTYSWNTATSKCVSCIAGSTTPTNNTTTTNNTNTTTNDTTTTYGYLLGAMTLGLLGFMA